MNKESERYTAVNYTSGITVSICLWLGMAECGVRGGGATNLEEHMALPKELGQGHTNTQPLITDEPGAKASGG